MKPGVNSRKASFSKDHLSIENIVLNLLQMVELMLKAPGAIIWELGNIWLLQLINTNSKI